LSLWVLVGRADGIAPGEHRVADADGTRILVFNLDGAYHAIEDVCTHDGGLLSGGGVEGDQVICPRHGARFSIRTGEALTAPAYEAAATFPVKIENGEVFVRDDRWD
jgi:3-phenylpropionate/trans-cinnamate dioxygenase ferredoxin subunit